MAPRKGRRTQRRDLLQGVSWTGGDVWCHEPVDLAVAGGTVVTPTAITRADVFVAAGRIVAVLPAAGEALAPSCPRARRTLDARGCLVLPGAVDAHVHFREPGLAHKEDWEHASLAAIAGGVTTVLDMPNVVPPTSTAARLAAKAALVAGRSRCHFALYGAMAAGGLDELAPMASAGARGFKVFLGETTASLPAPDDGELLQALARAADLGLRTMVHAENGGVLRASVARLVAPGGPGCDPASLAWHGLARPPVAEVEAVARVCLLAASARAALSIAHLSTAGAVAEVRRRKAAGDLDVRGEACPHHLLLTADQAATLGALAKVNPPLRSAADVDALWAGLADGTIDTVGSDHAPHASAEKEPEGGKITGAASGFAGVQNTVTLLLAAVAAGRLSLRRMVELCAEGPARAWGLWPRKGALAVGADADIAVWRPGPPPAPPRQWSLHPDSPLTRLRRPGGALVATLLDGEVVFAGDRPVGPPRGRWLRG